MTSLSKSQFTWWILSVLSVIVALWAGVGMYDLYQQDQLWGHLPLALCLGLYFSLSFAVFAIRKRRLQDRRIYLMSTLSGLMMGLSFPPMPFLLLLIPAWMILFQLSESELSQVGKSGFGRFRVYYHIFIIWNIISTFWICNTALAAGFIAILVNALLMSMVFVVYHILKSWIRSPYWFYLLASIWMSFEFLHFRWDIQWPWLTLGHYFMEQTNYVQWFEITGVYGGTFLILAICWISYKILEGWKKTGRVPLSKFGLWAAIILLPAMVSILLKPGVDNRSEEIKVAIIQPNYEPHYAKFQVPASTQMAQFVKLTRSVMDSTLDYLIFPETSFDVSLNSWDNHFVPQTLKRLLKEYRQLTLIAGMDTYKVLDDDDPHDQFTRTHIRQEGDTIFWENHNSAVRMADGLPMEIYYKSKLVPGAEYFPFSKIFFFLKPLMRKLGGTASGLRNQAERESFMGLDGHAAAPIICYESVFGEYVSGYIENGADWMVIMTNDGWWDNTAGHIQHLNLARLRAIEQRRDIARCANTGISCLIRKDGSVTQTTAYGVDDAIVVDVSPNQEVTFYATYGDYLARLAMMFFFGSIVFSLSRRFIKRPK